MDFIRQYAADQLCAGRLGVAWHAEQVALKMGLFIEDEHGNGPFIQELMRQKERVFS